MDLEGRTVALYGRFTPGVRDRLGEEITGRGAHVLRDLTRRCDLLVVGALAATLADSGALAGRLADARRRGVEVKGERGFTAALAGGPRTAPTLPLKGALAGAGLSQEDAELLAAFDLVEIDQGCCRFGDPRVMRAAHDLLERGRPRADVARILARARDMSPKGRHKIVLTAEGEAGLEWADGGVTSLEGQGYLPLEAEQAGLEGLFEEAALAEAKGRPGDAARLYDQCARADRSDAIAPYNLGNIRLGQGGFEAAALDYRRALARDEAFAEARYNLAQALEASGKSQEALAELERVVAADPTYADAVFNLAQLKMKADALGAAKALYERYLRLDPPPEWAAVARKAILVCSV